MTKTENIFETSIDVTFSELASLVESGGVVIGRVYKGPRSGSTNMIVCGADLDEESLVPQDPNKRYSYSNLIARFRISLYDEPGVCVWGLMERYANETFFSIAS